MVLRGVISVLAAHKSEDGDRFGVGNAVLDPNGDLAIGELPSSLP